MSPSLSSPWPQSLWPYRYTSLTSQQLRERRELLSLRGNYAQLSALVLLLLLSVYRFATSNLGTKGIERRSTLVSAWLDSPFMYGATEMRRHYLVAAGWLVWLLALSAWKTGDDHLHLTRSIAHTAMATTPLHLLLSPKLSPTFNPFTQVLSRLLHLPQTYLTPYHRLFGRLVIPTLLSLHAFLYIMFFVQNGLLEKRLNDADVQFGIVGILVMGALVGMSGWVKKRGSSKRASGSVSRGTAYLIHVSLAMCLLAVAYCHVEYARKFVVQAVGIYGVDVGSWVIKKVVERDVIMR
ncbi:hypothetical protein PABG_02072 [Paracoccidioides brasiliensis Pb03]|uniref:Ferric oxidoreductase domain-containing protein n=1 Tax=Paracoccidioides brasiliensis (strain Pb18) TaxID=502780 RepID=C1G0T0_PARBD|nr:uncharacterized protein PADG_00470 [Paracoccidioides brasiliensis Pb18]EEH19813.2 hypothetical protein PABG_02072 [Paracoccidioides brasiliensis Pb03]EEH44181.1 hypothetical protein PADG_00470 [Paracoccidioides brasiliensis Pb18]